jgi:anti-anti-sigma factor
LTFIVPWPPMALTSVFGDAATSPWLIATSLSSIWTVRGVVGLYTGGIADIHHLLAVRRDVGEPVFESITHNHLGLRIVGTSAIEGETPDRFLVGSIGVDVDPLAVRRIVRAVVMVNIGRELLLCAPIGGHAVNILNGRIDVDSSPDVRDCLLAILSGKQLVHVIIVDLSDVIHIEASGIVTLVEALKIAGHRQIRLHLQGLHGSVLRLFEVTGLLPLFEPKHDGKGVA